VTKVTKLLGQVFSLFDPRSSLAARISWVFAVLSLVLSVIMGSYISTLSQNIVKRDIGALYADRAQHVVDAVDLQVQSLFNSMELAASVFAATEESKGLAAAKQLIATAKGDIEGTVWIGFVDPSGIIVAGDGNRLTGRFVGDSTWFRKASAGDYLSGAEAFPMLDKVLGSSEASSYLIVTQPMKKPNGDIASYAVAAFDMDYVENIVLKSTKKLAGNRPIDVFLLDRSGKEITRNPGGVASLELSASDRLVQSIKRGSAEGDSSSFTTEKNLISYASSQSFYDFKGTGWIAVVREAKSSAFAQAQNLAWAIALSCLIMGLGLTLAAALGIRYILIGLSRIAHSADQLRAGFAQEFEAQTGKDEVSRISVSLASLFNNQKRSNDELAALNKNLDQKVIERTHEVQRLSEETRIAAVTRDRLRMSRDLHDTLAHSMLAMLTQIRLIQKLHKRKPELVAEELDLAERAAQEGLNVARAAVTDLRYFAVRDDGLAAALQKLVKKLKERMEIDIAFHIDDLAASLVGPTAETAYRVTEEAFHNIEKHSQARNVNLSAVLDDTDATQHFLKVSINDNGKGFELENVKSGHFGLIGMREQVEILKGKILIKSLKDQGTKIQFTLKL
jgi:signal transduction histidine kinase